MATQTPEGLDKLQHAMEGIPYEPDWWKNGPEDFYRQLQPIHNHDYEGRLRRKIVCSYELTPDAQAVIARYKSTLPHGWLKEAFIEAFGNPNRQPKTYTVATIYLDAVENRWEDPHGRNGVHSKRLDQPNVPFACRDGLSSTSNAIASESGYAVIWSDDPHIVIRRQVEERFSQQANQLETGCLQYDTLGTAEQDQRRARLNRAGYDMPCSKCTEAPDATPSGYFRIE